MPSTTLYYPDRDTPIWEAAKRVARRDGVSVSRVITEALEIGLPKRAAKQARNDKWDEIAAEEAGT